MNKNIQIVLTVWAIIIGGALLLTPEGINIIVTNPAWRFAIGAISVIVGVVGIIGMRGKGKTVGG